MVLRFRYLNAIDSFHLEYTPIGNRKQVYSFPFEIKNGIYGTFPQTFKFPNGISRPVKKKKSKFFELNTPNKSNHTIENAYQSQIQAFREHLQ